MEHLDGILRITERELSAIEQNGKYRSKDEIDSVYKLVDIAKDIYCIWDYEAGMEKSYYHDDDYARGRKRDSMGRYSRDYRGYSRDSRAEYIDGLRSLLETAPDDQTRQSIQRMISQME